MHINSFLPETLSCIVGDGSLSQPFIYRSWINIFKGKTQELSSIVDTPPPKPLGTPFRLLIYPDVLVGLFFGGLPFAIQYSISGTLASASQSRYPFLNSGNVGLCYLASGTGLLITAFSNGKLHDFDYRQAREKLTREAENNGMPEQYTCNNEKFPLEYVRLQRTPYLIVMYLARLISWGWCVEKSVFRRSFGAPS
ncbi:hypothetical protein DFS33DRAFT_743377 [Desarmillaria ectypa]|nr:hypothetical protein DFS33DRAFT_743377 [Desarmillaria ectypa]